MIILKILGGSKKFNFLSFFGNEKNSRSYHFFRMKTCLMPFWECVQNTPRNVVSKFQEKILKTQDFRAILKGGWDLTPPRGYFCHFHADATEVTYIWYISCICTYICSYSKVCTKIFHTYAQTYNLSIYILVCTYFHDYVHTQYKKKHTYFVHM